MAYKSVVFDVDGTLVDNEYAIICSLCSTLHKLGRGDIPAEQLTMALGIPGKMALQRLGIKDIDKAHQVWTEELQAATIPSQLFEQVEEMLVRLRQQGYSLGIVTSKTRDDYAKEVTPFGIDGFFEVCVFADMTERHKPHAAPLNAYLRLAGVQPKEVLYVGDSPYDAQCAQNAGMHFAHADWGAPKDVPVQARHRLRQPQDIFAVL